MLHNRQHIGVVKMEFVDPIYEKENIKKMKKELKRALKGDRNLLMFEIGLACAFRISDLLNLKVSDVKSGVVKIKQQKTKRIAEIHLNDRVYTLVRAFTDLMEDEDLLFPIDRVQAYRILRRAAEGVGIQNFGTHSMRKTKGYHFYIDSGFDIAETMRLLGQKTEESTLHYIGWTKEQSIEKQKTHDL